MHECAGQLSGSLGLVPATLEVCVWWRSVQAVDSQLMPVCCVHVMLSCVK